MFPRERLPRHRSQSRCGVARRYGGDLYQTREPGNSSPGQKTKPRASESCRRFAFVAAEVKAQATRSGANAKQIKTIARWNNAEVKTGAQIPFAASLSINQHNPKGFCQSRSASFP
jgi:hypothetical protein